MATVFLFAQLPVFRHPYQVTIGRRGCVVGRLTIESARMTFEQMPEEWQEWITLTPLERFRQSEQIFANYLAMGGSLDPDPDPTSPFDDPQTSSTGAAYGRAGLRVLRRGAV